jgi:hypothetical protein
MQVKVLVTNVLPLQCARGARLKGDALSQRVFLEHDADGVNDFLVQAGVTIDDHLMRSLGRGAPFGSDHPKSSRSSFARGLRFQTVKIVFLHSKTPRHGPGSMDQQTPSQRSDSCRLGLRMAPTCDKYCAALRAGGSAPR